MNLTVLGFIWVTRAITNPVKALVDGTSKTQLEVMKDTIAGYQNEQPGVEDRPSKEVWEAMRDCVECIEKLDKAVDKLDEEYTKAESEE